MVGLGRSLPKWKRFFEERCESPFWKHLVAAHQKHFEKFLDTGQLGRPEAGIQAPSHLQELASDNRLEAEVPLSSQLPVSIHIVDRS
jgi:hypothetical protein